MRPSDPMRTRATENGPADGWTGARIGAERRDRLRRAAAHVPAEIDLGEPGRPLVTFVFLALALIATFLEFVTFGATPTTDELARAGGASIGAVATGEWWKLVVANLLHGSIMHAAFNTVVILVVGRWIEHVVGRRVVLATVLTCIVTSTAGAVFASPESVTIGASGVAFGLLGCSVLVDPRGRTALGVVARPLVLVNVIFTFVLPGVSIGGHVGGLLGGVVVGALCWSRRTDAERPAGRARTATTLVTIAAAGAAVAALLAGPAPWPGDAAAARGRVVAPLLERRLERVAAGPELSSSCERTRDPRRYRCMVEEAFVEVEVTSGENRWVPVPSEG